MPSGKGHEQALVLTSGSYGASTHNEGFGDRARTSHGDGFVRVITIETIISNRF